MSKESPLNILGKALLGRTGKKGRRKIRKDLKAINKIVSNTNKGVKELAETVAAMGGGTVEPDIGESGYQTAVEGNVGDNVIQQGGDPLMKPTFDPNTQIAAEGMFGTEIEGSFDRALPGENDINDLV